MADEGSNHKNRDSRCGRPVDCDAEDYENRDDVAGVASINSICGEVSRPGTTSTY